MTVIYCPLKECEYNNAVRFEDEGICSKDEVQMGIGEYNSEFAYCVDEKVTKSRDIRKKPSYRSRKKNIEKHITRIEDQKKDQKEKDAK